MPRSGYVRPTRATSAARLRRARQVEGRLGLVCAAEAAKHLAEQVDLLREAARCEGLGIDLSQTAEVARSLRDLLAEIEASSKRWVGD
jgi:hypothetical protein